MSDQPLDKTVALVLYHNDLRIHDNSTLSKAVALTCENNGRLLLVCAPHLANSMAQKSGNQAYYFDEMGQARAQFLYESLDDLNKSLQRLGNQLIYLGDEGLSLENTPPKSGSQASGGFIQLCQLIEQTHVTDICVSQTADYNQNQMYETLQSRYPQIQWHRQSTSTLFATLPTKDLPKSFTQFRKKVESGYDLLSAETGLMICQTPKVLPPIPENINIMASSEDRTMAVDVTQQSQFGFKGGEANAIIHLNTYFESEAPSTYKTTRNALDNWAHSTKFSAWLANGSLSVKTLLNRLRQYEVDVVANDSTYWIWFELLWREYFYWYAVVHHKKLFWFRGISQHAPSTRLNQKRLAQWKNGSTPYPIVNACMHQLKSTGYMSNRGRQIVASAFIHELGLDWRYGATHFEQYLIDYDVGSNWGNWQYLAGVGADPRGCRQFNLRKQTQQHDPNGDFINKWQGS